MDNMFSVIAGYLLCVFISISAPVMAQSTPSPFDGYKLVDMSHAFDEDTIYWPTEAPFEHEEAFKGRTEGGWYYSAYRVNTAEHGGTHLDAPIHFAEGQWAADEIPLSSLLTPVVVIDVSGAALIDPDYTLSLEALHKWESIHGRIPRGSAVLMNTGYAQFWPDKIRYMGTAASGAEAISSLHFPGFSIDAARFLHLERGIVSVGLDTPSIDYGQSQDFAVHRYLYSHNIIGFENVANIASLPATGAFIVALPMKIKGGSGGPLRMIGLIPGD